MESFKVNLSQLDNRSKNQSYIFAILGLFYLAFGITKFTKTSNSDLSGLIWIITGIGFIISSFYNKKFVSKYILELNQEYVKAHPSLSKNIKISWNQIEQIHIKPISFDFMLKSGSKESISLGNIAYKDVLKTKEKLVEFANAKNITIN